MLKKQKRVTPVEPKYTYETKLKEPVKNDYLPVKRFFDVVSASGLMVATTPVVLLFGILVKLETPGKMFYTQERVGYMGKRFNVTKLRSMYNDAEKQSGAVWASKNDARVTKVGKFIRKTRIDELPQLWNVIKGDMSMIGPRPERPELTEKFSKEIKDFEQRLRVLPGLSGYAQVHGGYDISPEEKYELDKYYIDHLSMKEDLQIIWDTIRVVLTGDGAR
ncbi:sugar transferase [Ligilactobacillus cholophilus]|uniref:sugar transferase n=1 Tax=Ligilactobacillus cholophilus TaxID=3050131 RepID=UPI003EBD220A